MDFTECSVPFAGKDDIQDRFERLFIANGSPEEMALFCRTSEDRKSVVYLLTPTASELNGDSVRRPPVEQKPATVRQRAMSFRIRNDLSVCLFADRLENIGTEFRAQLGREAE